MENVRNLVGQLGRVKHFKGLQASDLEAIVKAGRIHQFPPDTVIFTEGDRCAGLFVLLSGRVHLCKLGPQGKEQILAVVEPVIMFNEVAALDGGSNPVTAVAVLDCATWRTDAESFHTLLVRYPQMAIGLLRVLARRNRFLIAQYEDLSFRSVLARTAKLLLDLSDYGQKPIKRHEYSNQEMAARIATVPEAFSRSLNIFKKNGYITTTRQTITLDQPDTLAELAQIGPVLPEG